MSNQSVFISALNERIGAEVVSEKRTDKQLRLMLRIKRGQSTTIWLSIIERLLELENEQKATGSPAWTIDISRQYFLDPDLKYGWRVILQGSPLDQHFSTLAKGVKEATVKSTAEVTEIPLYGNPNRRSGRQLVG